MASKEAKKYEQEEYEEYVSSGQEEDDLEFNKLLEERESKLSFIKTYKTKGEPGNCLLGVGIDIITCKATCELCIIHKNDKWGKNREKHLECPFDKYGEVIFKYRKERD